MGDIGAKLVFFLVGLLIFGIGAFILWRQRKLKKECTAQVPGVVSDQHHETTYKKGRRRDRYYPIFKYTVEDVEYIQKSNIGTSNRNVLAVGENVTVFYDPSNPKRHYVLEYRQSAFRAVKFFFYGGAFMIMAIGIYFFTWGYFFVFSNLKR